MADSANDLRFRELKDTIQELNTLIKTLRETVERLQAQQAEIKQERDNLKEQVDYLTKKLYRSSSEKSDGQFPGQLSFFDEAESEQDTPLPFEEDIAAVSPPERKTKKPRKNNAERFKGLPVEKIVLDVPEEERVCGVCDSPLEKIGEEFVRRELQFIPAKAKVLEYYSVSYGCPVCRQEAETPYIVKGKDGRAHMIHGMASASTVAWIIYQKYYNGMPLYRQESDWMQCGTEIRRATLANWIIWNANDFFRPMYEFFRRKLLEREFIMADETPVQVLHEPDRRAQARSYMWLYRSGEDEGPPIIIYKYSETRAGKNAVNFLDGYSGYIMCDGYSGYNKVKTAKRTTCWAHIRRYLLDAVPKGKEHDYTHPAVQGFMYVEKLFNLESGIRSKYKSFDEIRDARLEQEKPIIEGFLEWLDKQNPVKGTRMAKAVNYIRNRSPYLMTYLEDGRCSISNNTTENAIRPFVIGRKGWLFSDRPIGAEASAMCYTMVEMAKANEVNVYHYLTYLLENHPGSDMTDEQLEELAPWSEKTKTTVGGMAAADAKS